MWSHLSAQSVKIVYMGVAWLQFGYIINLAFLALIRSVDDITLWHPPSSVDQTMRLAAGVTTENRKAVRSSRGGGEWEQEAQRITRPLPFPETPPSPPLSLPLSSTSASPPRLAPSLARSLSPQSVTRWFWKEDNHPGNAAGMAWELLGLRFCKALFKGDAMEGAWVKAGRKGGFAAASALWAG